MQSGPRTPYHIRRLESYRAGMDLPVLGHHPERHGWIAAAIRVLSNPRTLAAAIQRVVHEWPNSCYHYFTTNDLDDRRRAEWLCRAACFLAVGSRDGSSLAAWGWLDHNQKTTARRIAHEAIQDWRNRDAGEGDGGAETLPLF